MSCYSEPRYFFCECERIWPALSLPGMVTSRFLRQANKLFRHISLALVLPVATTVVKGQSNALFTTSAFVTYDEDSMLPEVAIQDFPHWIMCYFCCFLLSVYTCLRVEHIEENHYVAHGRGLGFNALTCSTRGVRFYDEQGWSRTFTLWLPL